jgi:hypothetical protein
MRAPGIRVLRGDPADLLMGRDWLSDLNFSLDPLQEPEIEVASFRNGCVGGDQDGDKLMLSEWQWLQGP